MELLESRRVLASTFAHQVINLPLEGRSGVAMEVADLNADGRDDLIIGTGSGTVDVLLRNEDATFSNAQSLNVGGFVRSLSLADLDGDGQSTDLVVHMSERIAALLDQGSVDAEWQGYRLAAEAEVTYNRVEIANLNGDAIDDVVFADGDGLVIQLGRGTNSEGSLNFAEPLVWQLPSEIGLLHFDVGDVNQDGLDDIVATVPDISSLVLFGDPRGVISILTNDGAGSFDEQQFDGFAGSIDLFDFDLDGRLDFLASTLREGDVWEWESELYQGLGNSQFDKQGLVPGLDPYK